jgi:hypothetical protein
MYFNLNYPKIWKENLHYGKLNKKHYAMMVLKPLLTGGFIKNPKAVG